MQKFFFFFFLNISFLQQREYHTINIILSDISVIFVRSVYILMNYFIYIWVEEGFAMETFIPRVDIDNVSYRNTPFYVSFNLRRPTSIYDAGRSGETGWSMERWPIAEFVIFIVSLSVETRANVHPLRPSF